MADFLDMSELCSYSNNIKNNQVCNIPMLHRLTVIMLYPFGYRKQFYRGPGFRPIVLESISTLSSCFI